MTPEFLLELSRLPLFPRTAVDLCRVIGLDGAAKLITAWGGAVWDVPGRVGGGNRAGRIRYAQLAELVGEPAADRLIGYWGGSPLAIPNLKEVIWSRTQDKIRAEYDRLTLREGYSGRDACFALAIEFRVTNKAILNAINKPDNVLAEAVPQGDLF